MERLARCLPPLLLPGLLLLLLLLLRAPLAAGHATMTVPRARGALHQNHYHGLPWVIPEITLDACPHCSNANARGMPDKWRPYEPLNKDIPFRHDAGLCGDDMSLPAPRSHEKGGKYTSPASFPYSAVYEAGSVVEFEVGISTSHQGFFEFFLCDIGKCGGDISEKCFKAGHCRLLERAPDEECDSGESTHCGPIDPDHPGRWIMPCDLKKEGVQTYFYGGKYMKYKIPADFDCKDCVIQYYWATANSCNPPGFAEYFEKFPMKAWGSCPGDGGTVGGREASKEVCGAAKPEEFWNCADVRITSSRVPPPDYDMQVEFKLHDELPMQTASYGHVLEMMMEGSRGETLKAHLPHLGDDHDDDLANKKAPSHPAHPKPAATKSSSAAKPAPEKPAAHHHAAHHHATHEHAAPKQDAYKPGAHKHATPKPAAPTPAAAHHAPARTPAPHTQGAPVAPARTPAPVVTAVPIPRPGRAAGGCAATWAQCGGIGHAGPTRCCTTGEVCAKLSPYYHQCKKPEYV